MDALYNCYQSYSKMASSCTYYFVVAKTGKRYSINIQFELAQFIHLTGISDHLKDLPFARNSPGNLRKWIEEGRLTMADLAKSSNFRKDEIDIAARISCLSRLDEFLRSDNFVIDYLDRHASGSRLEADWLIRGNIDGELCYLFLVAKSSKEVTKDRSSGHYVCRSIFPYRGIAYGQYGRSMTTLLKQRNSTIGERTEILYRHPSCPDDYLKS